MSIRTERIAEQLRQEISVILRDEVTDPRVEMCSITRIKLSRDLSHAQVFWSPVAAGDVDVDEMEDGLVSAAPFVRRIVAQRLDLRRTPEIDFRYDPSIGEGDRMLALLNEVRADEDRRHPVDDERPDAPHAVEAAESEGTREGEREGEDGAAT